jgi:hypothetical protein
MMYYHFAYGLTICSSISLPEVVAVPETKPDVIIRVGQIGSYPQRASCSGGYFCLAPGEAFFYWDGVGAFLVRHGQEIIVDPLLGVSEDIIRLPLLGMVLSAVLQQRGILGLHASAIALHGGAVAFLGHKGQGKSTIATTFYARGHALVGDDLVAMDVNDLGHPMVLPGFPQLKLMPEAVIAALGDDPTQLRQLAAGYEKRARIATTGFSLARLPLKRLYILEEGETLAIEPLRPQDALLHVLGQSYPARIFRQGLQGQEAASNFTQCAGVATQVPAFRLKRPKSLTLLLATAQLLEEHNA